MKSKFTMVAIFMMVFGIFYGQEIKEYKFGTPIKISVPSNYVKIYDLNDTAIAQLADEAANKYFLVIQTEKENIALYQNSFVNISDVANYFSKSIIIGLNDDKQRSVTEPKEIKIGNYKAAEILIQGTMNFSNEDVSVDLFYHVTIIETANNYYQIISWSELKDRSKNLTEFKEIAKSFVEL